MSSTQSPWRVALTPATVVSRTWSTRVVEGHALGTERLAGRVDVLDLREQAAVLGRQRVGLQQQRPGDPVARAPGRVGEPAVGVHDAEIGQSAAAVEVRTEHQGGIVQPVGEVDELGEGRVGR